MEGDREGWFGGDAILGGGIALGAAAASISLLLAVAELATSTKISDAAGIPLVAFACAVSWISCALTVPLLCCSHRPCSACCGSPRPRSVLFWSLAGSLVTTALVSAAMAIDSPGCLLGDDDNDLPDPWPEYCLLAGALCSSAPTER